MSAADELRRRLRAARHDQPAALENEAYGRIVEHVVQHGPGQIRRSHQRQVVRRVLVIALPFALLTGWWVRDRDRERTPAVATRAACAERAAPQPQTRTEPDQSRRIDLGEVGEIVLDPGSEAQLSAADPCRLQLQLVRGRASVHAANLFGGELRVRAGVTDVVVHGTTFAVEQVDGAVLVDVETGAVAVAQHGKPIADLVRTGQRLRVTRAREVVLAPLALPVQERLRGRFAKTAAPLPPVIEAVPQRTLEAEPQPSKPAPPTAAAPERHTRVQSTAAKTPAVADASELVARADALWQRGALEEARVNYRAAGHATGPTAEAAWLSLARNELTLGHASAARAALAEHAQRFASGKLAGEAAGIEFRVALQTHDVAATERSARRLIERYPETPQADAAARWLRTREAKR